MFKMNIYVSLIFLVLIKISEEESILYSKLKKNYISLLLQDDGIDKYTPEKFNSSNSLILFNLSDQFNKYFQVNTSEENIKKCRDFIFNDLILDYNYKNFFFYSGHKLNDIGDPIECLNNNGTFLLALLTFGLSKNMTKLEDQMSLFTSKNKSNIGICIWNECYDFVKDHIMNNLNQKFKMSMDYLYDIKDIKIILKNNNIKHEYSKGIKAFLIILSIYISIYVCLKFIIWIYNKYKELSIKTGRRKKKDYLKIDEATIIKEEDNEDEDNSCDYRDEIESEIKNKKNSKDYKNKSGEKEENEEEEENKEEEDNNEEEEEEEDDEDKDDSKISNDSLFRKDIEESKIRYFERNLKKMGNNLSINRTGIDDVNENNKNDKKMNLLNNNLDEKRGKLTGFLYFFQKFNNNFFQYLGPKVLTENKIYSNKNLEMITGFRALFLIFITVNVIFHSFQENPSVKDITNSFLRSILFFLIKFSNYGFYFWVYLDGFSHIFKLMNFIQKDRSFKNFVKFGINLIPKMFVFIIIFSVIYYLQKDIGKIFQPSSILFEQYTDNEYNYKCLSNPIYLLFPFINTITTDNNMVYNYFNNCYKFSYLIINEFYCIIISSLIIYLMYKFKSKIIDIIVTIFILLNIIGLNFLPYFFENIKDEKYFLLKYVLGETFSLRYPHSMFNIFSIGLFCGLIYYYHYYSLNDLNSFMSEEYLPFSYLSKLMQLILKCNIFIKILLIIISLAIIVLDLLLFYIIKMNGENSQVLYNFSSALKIFYLYETNIIILAISILFIFLIFAEEKFQIKSFLGNKIFFIMEKISFCYICLIEMINLLYLSKSNDIGDIWSYIAFLYITCYEVLVGLISSLFFTLFFELPVKIIVNNIKGKVVK